MMLISTSVLIGAAAFTTLFGATSIAIDKKLNYYPLNILLNCSFENKNESNSDILLCSIQ